MDFFWQCRMGLFLVFILLSISPAHSQESDFDFVDRQHDSVVSTLLDDEDLLLGSGSHPEHEKETDYEVGSGSETESPKQPLFPPPKNIPEKLRMTVNITSETFKPTYAVNTSSDFHALAFVIQQQFEKHFDFLPGKITFQVIQISPGTVQNASRSLIVTMNVVSDTFYDASVMSESSNALKASKIGSFSVNPDDMRVYPLSINDATSNYCAQQMGREPTSMPRLNDVRLQLLSHLSPTCFSWLHKIEYFRGSPEGSVFIGVWGASEKKGHVLKHKIELKPDRIGVHVIHLAEMIPVSRSDVIGIHYAKSMRTGVIGFATAEDLKVARDRLPSIIEVDLRDEQIEVGEEMNFVGFKMSEEHKDFALRVFYTNDPFKHAQDKDMHAVEKSCRHDQYRCNDGVCIPHEKKCNKIPDCADRSDEFYCPVDSGSLSGAREDCRPDQFRCDNRNCIDDHLMCNLQDDCGDNSDEEDCPDAVGACAGDELTCSNGNCVNVMYKCDGNDDCEDGSDEQSCGSDHGTIRCSSDEFECRSGACVATEQRCDGVPHCDDDSDEHNCDRREEVDDSQCAHHEFQCGDGQCVDKALRCDNNYDCQDASDEVDCQCSADEFRCNDGKCLPESSKCDGRVDCFEGEDEYHADCGKKCGTNMMECSDGQCIRFDQLCNGQYDCQDGSDELTCVEDDKTHGTSHCQPDEFRCEDGQCIEASLRCDYKYDCTDGSDEQQCDAPTQQPAIPTRAAPPSSRCEVNQFECASGECVLAEYRCDNYRDCSDNSDEENCGGAPITPAPPAVTESPCQYYEMHCGSGECVDERRKCDGHMDCADGADELGCGFPTTESQCQYYEMQCGSGECVDERRKCDGHRDCSDGADESSCADDRLSCSANEFQCSDGLCIDARLKCNQQYDCPDGLDERECDTEAAQCSSNEFQCSDGECIAKALRCDHKYDCRDGTDEFDCSLQPHACSEDEFRCGDGECIDSTLICNRQYDCQDASDEADCAMPTQPPSPSRPVVCSSSQFRCLDGKCIDANKLCDRNFDCFDQSDEAQCGLTVTPSELRIRNGMSATFICRSRNNAKLVWQRPGRAMPRRVFDDGQGRLVIDNVEVPDSGEYKCTVAGRSDAYSGVAILTVETIVGPVQPVPRPGKCGAGQSMCGNGACIPLDYLCDGDYDCVDRSDELSCVNTQPCEPNEFRCSSSKCILKIWQCDGDDDCGGDNSDEKSCDIRETSSGCRTDQFQCHSANQCVPFGYHCDGERDCQDGSDESGCMRPEVVLAPPSEASVNEGDTLVLKCDAMGIPPPLIIWRLNWGHVGDPPRVAIAVEKTPGSHVSRPVVSHGTLTIQRIGKQDEGAYTCEAVNSIGSLFVVPDTIVHVLTPSESCGPGFQYENGRCVRACNCHQHSNDCRGGRCLQCQHNTVGDTCERCKPGYYGDATRGTPQDCRICPCPTATSQQGGECFVRSDGEVSCLSCPPGFQGAKCDQCAPGYQGNPRLPGGTCAPAQPDNRQTCDIDGSLSPYPDPRTGQCSCKLYTEGRRCESCKPYSFYPSRINPEGCISCFCMGVTQQCTSTSWRRTPIVSDFSRSSQGVVLLERVALVPIPVQASGGQIKYNQFSRLPKGSYYWSLPEQFLQDKLTSYGGNLIYTISHLPGFDESPTSYPDVEISGNDIVLEYTHNAPIPSNKPVVITVPLYENVWRRADGTKATREHLMMTLANLNFLRIKAMYTNSQAESTLKEVKLDIANDRTTGAIAYPVEQCSCPPGYKGLSCEYCDVGYRRSGGGLYLGSCESCECYGHSDKCDWETGLCRDCKHNTAGQACDVCAPGYYGDATLGLANDCKRCPCPVMPGQSFATCGQDEFGEAICNECPYPRAGSKCEKCIDGFYGNPAAPGGSCRPSSERTDDYEEPEVEPRFQQPQLIVTPDRVDAYVGNMATMRCYVEGDDRITIRWLRQDGRSINPRVRMNSDGSMQFDQLEMRDAGGYLCVAGSLQAFVNVAVHEIQGHREDEDHGQDHGQDRGHGTGHGDLVVHVQEPIRQVVSEGSVVQFICVGNSPNMYVVSWKRKDNYPLDRRAVDDGQGGLTISDVQLSDAGIYVCVGSDHIQESTQEAVLVVEGADERVSEVLIDHSDLRVGEGEEARLNCISRSHIEVEAIRWSTEQGDLPEGAYEQSGQLVIPRCEKQHENVYICTIYYVNGQQSTAYSRIQIEEHFNPTEHHGRWDEEPEHGHGGSDGEAPSQISIKPDHQSVQEGATVLIECSANGQPKPTITWEKAHEQLTSRHQAQGSVMRIIGVTVEDRGAYLCTAENQHGRTYGYASLEVEPYRNDHEQPHGESHPDFNPDSHPDFNPDSHPDSHPGSHPDFHTPGAKLMISPSGHVTILEGETLRLECWTTIEPDALVGWYTPTNEFIDGHGRAVLEIERVEPHHSGYYQCYGQLAAGDAYESTLVEVSSRNGNDGRHGHHVNARDDGKSDPHGHPNHIPEDHLNEGNHGNPHLPRDQGIQIVPSQVRTALGSRVEFTCSLHLAHGHDISEIEVEWLLPGTNEWESGDNVLVIQSVQQEDAGTYRCRDPSGGTEDYATLTLLDLPMVTISRGTVTLRPGESLELDCEAQGTPHMTITWTHNDRPLAGHVYAYEGHLQISAVQPEDAGAYHCIATNSAGHSEAISNVIIIGAPTVSVEPRSIYQTIGQTVIFECRAEGSPTPQIQWRKDNGHLPQRHLAQGGTLTLYNIQPHDEGRYVCHATNEAGTVRDHADLIITENSITDDDDEPSIVTAMVGDRVELNCDILAGNGQVIVQWNKIGAEMPSSVEMHDALAIFPSVEGEHAGVYRCTAASPRGSSSAQIRLLINMPPEMIVVNQERKVAKGTAIRLKCLVRGSPEPTITWLRKYSTMPIGHEVVDGVLLIPSIKFEDYGRYTCIATNIHGSTEGHVDIKYGALVASFGNNDNSFISYPGLKEKNNKFDIEISFKPQSDDGLILYNGVKEGDGDFVAIGLQGGRLEALVDVGSQPVHIISNQYVRRDEWHTAHLKRDGKMVILMLDEEELSAEISGNQVGLNVNDDLFLGSVPHFDRLSRHATFNEGFTGCISQLVLNGADISLGGQFVDIVGVTECPVCDTDHCQNGGSCFEANRKQGFQCVCPTDYTGDKCQYYGTQCRPDTCGRMGKCMEQTSDPGYKCVCPLGLHGQDCSSGEKIEHPSFKSGSFISYPTLSHAQFDASIKFSVLPESLDDAILLYNAFSKDGAGDFIAVILKDGFVNFLFNTGSGAANIKSAQALQANEWSIIAVERHQQEGSLSINGGTPVKGRSRSSSSSGRTPGNKVGLNLKTDLYIGGVDSSEIRVASTVGVNQGFNGCIQQVVLNRIPLNLAEVTGQRDISECQENMHASTVCASHACSNGGTCHELQQAPKCDCLVGFTGDHCEIESTIEYAAEFVGDGYLELRSSLLPHLVPLEREVVELSIITTEPDGLLLWHGQPPSVSGRQKDYFAIAVVNGFAVFTYELGSGAAFINASTYVINDGLVHHIRVERTGQKGSIEIDGFAYFDGKSSGEMTGLNTLGNIYIGGLPDAYLMTAGKFRKGFEGCISQVQIDEDEHIDLGAEALSGINVEPCRQ